MPKTSKVSKPSPKRSVKLESNSIERSMIIEKLPGYFLIVCLLMVFAALLYILWPFITVIFVAAVLTVSFYPVYKKLVQWLRGWTRTSSFLTCILVILIIVGPLSAFVLLLTSEAVNTYELVQEKINSGAFDQYFQWEDGGFFYDLKNELEPLVDVEQIDIRENIISFAQNLSTFLVSQTANIIKSISSIAVSLIVMLFCMYYFFKDGDKLVDKVGALSPLPTQYETELFKKIQSMVKAVVFGVFVTAIAQGLVGGIGFAILSVPNPVFWGTAVAFFSLVPVVGTAMIWVPAAIIFAALGQYGSAIFMLLWGLLAIGSVDNILRPYLIGGKAHTYPLMTFLVVLGGVIVLGLKGVVIGPLILIILMSFVHIYEAEYRRVLKH